MNSTRHLWAASSWCVVPQGSGTPFVDVVGAPICLCTNGLSRALLLIYYRITTIILQSRPRDPTQLQDS